MPASDDITRRTRAVRAIIRVGTNASYQEVANSTERAILTAAYGSLRSTGTSDWRHDALVDGERNVAALFGDLYLELSSGFGYRLRPGFMIGQFSTGAAALVEGVAMREGVSDDLVGIQRPTGDDGELEDWTLYGIAFEGLFLTFFEPTGPDVFADLSRY